ncbi:MAG: acVLRF1 family peptidyl-tRNA hydrolase [Marmoricola sp.]
MTEVLVPPPRLARWVENFGTRHGGAALEVASGALVGRANDGSTFSARLPFAASYDDVAEVDPFLDACAPPERWGVLLVRKGGFAIARLERATTVESKVGQRHVQGRTKAGGQSQQRFARRRDNQARVAYEAAAEHAGRILEAVELVVTGGDHAAVEAVLSDRRLAALVVVPPFLAVPDPKRGVLEQAVADACSVQIDVVNA